MLKRDSRVSTAGEAVQGLLRSLGLWDRARQEQAAVVWEDVVGKAVAAKTEVIRVERGVLYVRTEGAVWAQELALHEDQILRRLRDKLGDNVVQAIRFSTRGRAQPSEEEEQERAAPHPGRGELEAITLNEEEKAAVAEAAKAAAPELAPAVQKLLAAQMRLDRWRRQHGWRPGKCGAGDVTRRGKIWAMAQKASGVKWNGSMNSAGASPGRIRRGCLSMESFTPARR